MVLGNFSSNFSRVNKPLFLICVFQSLHSGMPWSCPSWLRKQIKSVLNWRKTRCSAGMTRWYRATVYKYDFIRQRINKLRCCVIANGPCEEADILFIKKGLKINWTLVCCRHESSEADNLEQGGLQQVRVQNTKLGITTFWSLDKFQNNIAAMRELEQVSFKSVLTFPLFTFFAVALMVQNIFGSVWNLNNIFTGKRIWLNVSWFMVWRQHRCSYLWF